MLLLEGPNPPVSGLLEWLKLVCTFTEVSLSRHLLLIPQPWSDETQCLSQSRGLLTDAFFFLLGNREIVDSGLSP